MVAARFGILMALLRRVQTGGQEASVTIAIRRCAVPHGRNEFGSDAAQSCEDIYSGRRRWVGRHDLCSGGNGVRVRTHCV
jgi:hypothetical protein